MMIILTWVMDLSYSVGTFVERGAASVIPFEGEESSVQSS
jgi:hypothetical protein